MLRVIPRLEIKGENLVKGIQFEGIRVLGKPEWFARAYYEEGADELLFIDAVASLYGRNNLAEIVRRTAEEIFVPLTVGGGLRTLADIGAMLEAGADKVAINTAAVARPAFISEAARMFGTQCLVVHLQAKARGEGCWEPLTDYGREKTGLDAVAWARQAEELGAGELLVSSVDRDGTGRGCDLGLLRAVTGAVRIPVIAGSGAGSLQHIGEAVTAARPAAVAVGSLFHYDLVRRFLTGTDLAAHFGDVNVEYLRQLCAGGCGTGFAAGSIAAVKAQLRTLGCKCRAA